MVKKTEKTSNEVAVKQENAGITTFDFGDDAGSGMEGISRDEIRIPLIRILQANSPQCAPVSAGGLKGADAGDFLNTSTNEIYKGNPGFDFIPAHRDHNYIEWIPKDDNGNGGGFVSTRAEDDEEVRELKSKQGRFGKLRSRDGSTEFAETYYLLGFGYVNNQWTMMCIPFASTQIKKYQTLITRVNSIKYTNASGKMVSPPLWFHRWNVSSVFETHKKGNIYGFNITLSEKNEDGTEAPSIKSIVPPKDPMYQICKKLHMDLSAGTIKADMSHASGEDGSEPSSLDDENSPL